MGWTGTTYNGNKKETFINYIKNMIRYNSKKYELLGITLNGNVGWSIIKNVETNSNFILCTLIKTFKSQNEICFKDMDTACHPFYYNCPYKFVKQIHIQYQNDIEWLTIYMDKKLNK
jgi:hypothetical protein